MNDHSSDHRKLIDPPPDQKTGPFRTTARQWRPAMFHLVGLIGLLGLWLVTSHTVIQAQTPLRWTKPVVISEGDRFNWFADVTEDIYGTVHVIWDGGPSEAESLAQPDTEVSLLLHSQLGEDGRWSPPLDVDAKINVEGHIYRGAVTADLSGNLLVLYEGDLIKAPAQKSNESAQFWAEAYAVSRGAVYMGAVAVDSNGILHALYDELTLLDEPIRGVFGQVTLSYLSDVFYRRSLDGGRSWSEPINFSHTQVGEHREKLEIDPAGNIYATWDEGWDRLTEIGQPETGVLLISRDGGQTWSPKIEFVVPERSNAQFVATGDGNGGVLAVWRATSRNEIFYSWSTDWGASWSLPQPIPRIFTRDWEETRFDSYDLAVDSGGTIHLVAVGRLDPEPKETQVYHLAWNGRAWSDPALVYGDAGWSEYPRVIVAQGNRLHLVWFVRDQLQTTGGRYQILYSGAQLNTPGQPLPPTPTVTPSPTTTATPIITPTPTRPSVSITQEEIKAVHELSTILYTENDDLWLLTKSLAPVLLVIVGVFVGRRFFARGGKS